MLGAQVAVAVAHVTRGGARSELVVAAVQESDREAVGRGEARIADVAGKRQQRREVLAHGRGHLRRSEAARRRRLGGGVEAAI